MEAIETDVLVVGGGTGGTAAAIQAARRGAQTILVSEFPWLGGMLTSAGVSAPDGNELAAFQSGIWGAFLRELRRRQPDGLDHAWVSFFTYEPRIGAEIFADWVQELPNLHWIAGQVPKAVYRQGNQITGIRFSDVTIQARMTLDGTELGDVLALAEVPYRWGWEWRSHFHEPSAPDVSNELTQRYPIQAPTWVVMLQDFGEGAIAAEIPPPPDDNPAQFIGTWEGYGAETFLNYGRLPGHRFMLNFPKRGNDYGQGLERLIQSPTAREEFLQEARWHSQSYARFLQSQLGRRYGLANSAFPLGNGEVGRIPYSPSPHLPTSIGGGAFALHPYYRESRRLQGLVTVREQDILPIPGGQVAALPVDATGVVTAIALGNYPNDHHYPGKDFPLAPKSVRWGGRWTGTPFALPYGCLIPAEVDGLLVCEKNSSVSHIANGATRLQPVVLGLGQAAGMAAALCMERGCQPRELPVRVLQEALLGDPVAPAAMIPLFNVVPEHPDWLVWQRYYLDYPESYPANGNAPLTTKFVSSMAIAGQPSDRFLGVYQRRGEQQYAIRLTEGYPSNAGRLKGDGGGQRGTPAHLQWVANQTLALVTLHPDVDEQLLAYGDGEVLEVWGHLNRAGGWLLVERVAIATQIVDVGMTSGETGNFGNP
jgi:hypothetical protein